MPSLNKTKNLKDEYLTEIRERIDDLEFKIEAFKMKLAIVPDPIQKYYLERIEIFSQKKEALNDTIKELEKVEENVWENVRNKIEVAWNDLKGGIEAITERFRNEVPDKEEFINRIEWYLAEINLNMAGHEKKLKDKVEEINESVIQKYDKQVEQLLKNREFILKKLDELKTSKNNAELEIRECIANSMDNFKKDWEEVKSKL